MSILSRLERGIRGAVESVFGRAFGGGLQPAEIRRRLMTVLTASEQPSEGGSRIANWFLVDLCPGDLEELGPSLPALTATLIEEIEERALRAGWDTSGPFDVEFRARPGFATGQFEVTPERRSGTPGFRVRVVSGPDQEKTFEVAGREVVIGRQPSAGVALTDGDASRNHAVLRSDGYRTTLQDLGSTNGTFVNGRRISKQEIRPGARIEVGRCVLEISRGRPVWDDGGEDRV